MNSALGPQETLGAWLAREQEQAARYAGGVGPGVLQHRDLESMDGLQTLQAIMAGRLPSPPIMKTLDFMLLEAEEGRAVFQGAPGPAHLNPMGGIHGGWYATLLDSAMACAVHTRMPRGRSYTTAEFSINIVRAIGGRAPRVRAEGTVLHQGRQLATAEGRLYGPDGTLYAHATTTCLVFEARPMT